MTRLVNQLNDWREWLLKNPRALTVTIFAVLLMGLIIRHVARTIAACRLRSRIRLVNTTGAPHSGCSGTCLTYRTLDGMLTIPFEFVQVGGGWRIYILSSPPYDAFGRDSSNLATHRLSEGGRFFICWGGHISSLNAAKGVAALWSEKSSQYLRTGRGF